MIEIDPDFVRTLFSQLLGTGVVGAIVWRWASKVTAELESIKKDIHSIEVHQAQTSGVNEGEVKRLWDQVQSLNSRLARAEASDAQIWKKIDRARNKMEGAEA